MAAMLALAVAHGVLQEGGELDQHLVLGGNRERLLPARGDYPLVDVADWAPVTGGA